MGSAPSAKVPEPSSLLLIGLGLAGLAGFHRGLRSKKGEHTMIGRKRGKGSLIIPMVILLGLLGVAGQGEALPYSSFTGSTFMDSGGSGVSGTVNYAVFQGTDLPTDFLSSFVPGQGSPSLDLSGVVYLFQVTNNGFNNVPISGLNVGIPGIMPTSWGYFSHTIFVDTSAGGANVDATNNLGTDETKPAGGSAPRVGVTDVGFAVYSGAVDPSLVKVNPGIDVQNFTVAPEVLAGQTSALFVYTAHAEPGFVDAVMSNTGTEAYGPVPGPTGAPLTVPEPVTPLLLGTGLIALAAWSHWRRRPDV